MTYCVINLLLMTKEDGTEHLLLNVSPFTYNVVESVLISLSMFTHFTFMS